MNIQWAIQNLFFRF